jgi:hypothetical protein
MDKALQATTYNHQYKGMKKISTEYQYWTSLGSLLALFGTIFPKTREKPTQHKTISASLTKHQEHPLPLSSSTKNHADRPFERHLRCSWTHAQKVSVVYRYPKKANMPYCHTTNITNTSPKIQDIHQSSCPIGKKRQKFLVRSSEHFCCRLH